jgi:flagellar hook-associated protein 1
MSLTAALNTARAALQTTSQQIAVSGRNIAGANDPSYSRTIALPVTTADGSAQVLTITRASNAALYGRMLVATSSSTSQQALLDGLNQLQQTVGDTDTSQSPAAKITALVTSLQQYANAPDNSQLGQAAVTAANDLTTGLNAASQTVQKVRSDADAQIGASVTHINDLLTQFGTLNADITRQTGTGADVTGEMDQRDAIVGQLSQEIGVTVLNRANNDMALYTDSGVPLFDGAARSVTFKPTASLAPGAAGNAVFVDGVPVTGSTSTMPIKSGKIAGLAQLRDQVAPAYQNQLDEISRGLIETFAEKDQTGGGGADATGLFTWSGGPAVPASGTIVPGLANQITVNPAVDPAKGGSVTDLRDGGINGGNYVYNSTGAAAFADRLNTLASDLNSPRSFDAKAQLGTSADVPAYATSSASWLENLRQTASTNNDYQQTLLSQASTALSNATGVNLDEEYANQLQLEQSYTASSKLIAVVGQLFDQLMAAFK